MQTPNVFGGDPIEEPDYDISQRGDEVPSYEDQLMAEQEAKAEPAPEASAPEPEEPPEPETPEPEVEEEKPEEEEPKEKKQNRFVPRDRLNEVLEQKRAAERRLQELEARLAQPVAIEQFDFDSKEKEYMSAVLEGDEAKALDIRREIRTAELTAAQRVAEAQALQAKTAIRAEAEFEAVVTKLSTDYPVFDPNAEDYNQELVDEALELQSGFVQRGYTPADAMNRAVKYVAKMHDLVPETEKAKAPKAEPKRGTSTVRSKLELAAAQPPMQVGTANADAEPDYRTLSDADWDKLPASTIARLRGDFM